MTKPIKKILILIVEDEKILADTLRERLEKENFIVLNAYDGLEGFELAIKEHPDLILIDILIPKIDGIAMIKKLSKDSWGKNAKIIILSNLNGSINPVTGDVFAELDPDYKYLTKSNVSLEKIVSEIKNKLKINN